jgi:hypothetical protein
MKNSLQPWPVRSVKVHGRIRHDASVKKAFSRRPLPKICFLDADVLQIGCIWPVTYEVKKGNKKIFKKAVTSAFQNPSIGV